MKDQETPITAWRDLLAYNAEVVYRIERELKAAGTIPLSAYDILIELYQAPEKRLRMYDLSKACILTKSGATKIVNTLEKQGYLKREKCPSDLRGFHAVITTKGISAVRKAWAVYSRCIEAFFTSALSTTEHRQLAAIMPKLRAHLPDNFMAQACSE
ncbi:MarR family winged helix-turn-helix transcriptional regulator [Turneriella parva]|uniref:Transcriptional regulator, MarR family n=1 Tax=Turneriella parva (strain ATCC BAA-1111 / DSM 21527 / NCTC 11395 / H) TaxID=869212 RepID=I4B0P5_TURPD|nr:MarR family transcriptional regulator [Turneriella parva]AFM10852.1 transcriptional regulator, MarR family [Turneriella parva DSM 21527]